MVALLGLAWPLPAHPDLLAGRAENLGSLQRLADDAIPSGIVIKFREGTGIRLRSGVLLAFDTATDEGLGGELSRALVTEAVATAQLDIERHSRMRDLSRLFDVAEAVLDERRRVAEESCAGLTLADLNLYFLIRLQPGSTFADVADLVAALHGNPVVEEVYSRSLPIAQNGKPRIVAVDSSRSEPVVRRRELLDPRFPEPLGVAPEILQSALALAAAGPSGIVLIQAQLLVEGASEIQALPVEYEPAVFDVIRNSTCHGLQVMEAAGDSAVDLDAPLFQDRFDRWSNDSGAVVVGVGSQGGEGPAPSANVGDRIDFFAPLAENAGESPELAASSEEAVAVVGSLISDFQKERQALELQPLLPVEIRDMLRVEEGAAPSSDQLAADREEEPAAEDHEEELNSPPMAEGEEFIIASDSAVLELSHSQLLSNDFDPEDDVLHFAGIASEPRHGRLRKTSSHIFYIPGTDFATAGEDSFTYRITDREEDAGESVEATVVIRANHLPQTEGDVVYLAAGSRRLEIDHEDLLANDTDSDGQTIWIDAIWTSHPSFGRLDEARGRYIFVPEPEFWQHCEDSFTYRVRDGEGDAAAISPPTEVKVLCRPIFEDSFDVAGTSSWGVVHTDSGGTVEVSAAAAIHGPYGLEVGTGGLAYVEDQTPAGEIGYRASFHFDPSASRLADGGELSIFSARQDSSGIGVFDLRLRHQQGRWVLLARMRDGAKGQWTTGEAVQLDASARIEVRWWAAAEGGLELHIDGQLVSTLHGDNVGLEIDRVRLGALELSGASGHLAFDRFTSYPI